MICLIICNRDSGSHRDCFAFQILGLLITYFLLVVQFTTASDGSTTSTDATNSTILITSTSSF